MGIDVQKRLAIMLYVWFTVWNVFHFRYENGLSKSFLWIPI